MRQLKILTDNTGWFNCSNAKINISKQFCMIFEILKSDFLYRNSRAVGTFLYKISLLFKALHIKYEFSKIASAELCYLLTSMPFERNFSDNQNIKG